MTRSELIDNYFRDHCANIGIISNPVDRGLFTALAVDSTNLYGPYGWLPPTFVWYPAEDGLEYRRFTFIYCNEVILHQVVTLSDADLMQYLDVIHYYVNLHVTYCETPVALRDKIIEEELWRVAPGSMVFLNRFQMAVLDSVN